MRVDVFVDASRERRDRHAVAGREPAFLLLGDAPHPQAPRFAVRLHGRRASNLRQLSRRAPPQAVHLPQAVLRHGVTFQKKGVLHTRRVNVRDTQRIARNSRRSGNANGNRSGCLAKRPPGVPIHGDAKGDQQNGNDYIHGPEQGSVEHCFECSELSVWGRIVHRIRSGDPARVFQTHLARLETARSLESCPTFRRTTLDLCRCD